MQAVPTSSPRLSSGELRELYRIVRLRRASTLVEIAEHLESQAAFLRAVAALPTAGRPTRRRN
jgi:hypothetical protein